jgi:hypothetical protein
MINIRTKPYARGIELPSLLEKIHDSQIMEDVLVQIEE